MQQYCLRKYNNIFYYARHPDTINEIKDRLERAISSERNSKEFFNQGMQNTRIISQKSLDIKLLEDEEFVYALKGLRVFTILNVPGTDKISDFIRESKKKN